MAEVAQEELVAPAATVAKVVGKVVRVAWVVGKEEVAARRGVLGALEGGEDGAAVVSEDSTAQTGHRTTRRDRRRPQAWQ